MGEGLLLVAPEYENALGPQFKVLSYYLFSF